MLGCSTYVAKRRREIEGRKRLESLGYIPCLPRSVPFKLLYICWNKDKHVNKPKEED
jgi:hypothetical protein